MNEMKGSSEIDRGFGGFWTFSHAAEYPCFAAPSLRRVPTDDANAKKHTNAASAVCVSCRNAKWDTILVFAFCWPGHVWHYTDLTFLSNRTLSRFLLFVFVFASSDR